jgi:hypothetical protein
MSVRKARKSQLHIGKQIHFHNRDSFIISKHFHIAQSHPMLKKEDIKSLRKWLV